MPQWIAREYLAPVVMPNPPEQIRKAHSPLLGYTMHHSLLKAAWLPAGSYR